MQLIFHVYQSKSKSVFCEYLREAQKMFMLLRNVVLKLDDIVETEEILSFLVKLFNIKFNEICVIFSRLESCVR